MTLGDIVDFCYSMRQPEFDEIKQLSKKSLDDYESLAHFIWRLGATRSAVRAIVEGVKKVPDLRKIGCIRTLDAPVVQEVRLDQRDLTPYEIVRGIYVEASHKNPVQIEQALHKVVDLDLPSLSGGIRTSLASRSTIITRVHAELQVADKFSRDRRGMAFVGDDKYIGCSKPACYFCFNWLSGHKHGYVPPATHNKIIVGCRGPDQDVNESGAAVLTAMYSRLCSQLGHDILDRLLHFEPRSARTAFQYQSTEGSIYA